MKNKNAKPLFYKLLKSQKKLAEACSNDSLMTHEVLLAVSDWMKCFGHFCDAVGKKNATK